MTRPGVILQIKFPGDTHWTSLSGPVSVPAYYLARALLFIAPGGPKIRRLRPLPDGRTLVTIPAETRWRRWTR